MTFPRGTEKNYEAFKNFGVLAEIQIDHLKNTRTKKSPLNLNDW